jgi:hypothetical protein
MIGIINPSTYDCKVSCGQYCIVFDLHVIFITLEQAEPYSSFRITVNDSDIVISQIIDYDVYDTYVPTTQHMVLATIQLIKVKIKGVNHTDIYARKFSSCEAAAQDIL